MDGPMAAHTIAHYFFAFLFTTVNILPIATLAILQYISSYYHQSVFNSAKS